MTDGQRFTNAAYIEPGWVLVLPAGVTPPVADAGATSEPAAVHVVEQGETLWSIAGEELGAPTRWPEIWELNRGDDMGDGRVLVEPDLIMPGWELELPTSNAAGIAAAVTAPPIATPPVPPSATTPAAPTTAASTYAARTATRRRAHRGRDHGRPAGTSRTTTDERPARSGCVGCTGGHDPAVVARRRRLAATRG